MTDDHREPPLSGDVISFDRAAQEAVRHLTREQLHKVADWLAGDPRGAEIFQQVDSPYRREIISNVLGSCNVGPDEMRLRRARMLIAMADE